MLVNAAVKEASKPRKSVRRHGHSINRAEILGEVAGKPVKRVTQNGRDYMIFNVITTSTSEDADGEMFDQKDTHTVMAFGGMASVVEAKVGKGTRVLVHGRLQTIGGGFKDGRRLPRLTSIRAETVQPLAEEGNKKKSEDDF